jgi:alanyl-tRNA synthetase
MLGNFSFGDYFKQEAIPFAWTLLTEEWKIPADRLVATVFRGEAKIPRDDEAYDLWRRFLPASRIGELGAADNFWQMGDTGPCGRCSEIYFFRGAELPCAEEAEGRACRGVECSCGRYIEIWNNVFMEFDRQPGGGLNPLPARSIDTGMGLERTTSVLQGRTSNYDTDLFMPLLEAIGGLAGTRHRGTMEPADVSMRVVADHMRAMTFLITDGVMPSNEHRGYVLRKIMRRAMRHGKRLGVTGSFLHTLVDTIVRDFGEAYPELKSSRDTVVQVVRSEEERFDAVLTGGLPRLEDALDRAAAGDGVLTGDIAFRLYDTYGLPLDFIEDMVEDRRLTFDREGFERDMGSQREKARAKSTFRTGAPQGAAWTADDTARAELERIGEGVFRGYDTTRLNSQIVALFDAKQEQVASLPAGATGFVALAETPFYIEAGGQVSDVGTIAGPGGEAQVDSVIRVPGWPRLHGVRMLRGALAARDLVTAEVADAPRDATRRNHTATHLLHAALRHVLGGHVKQAGSLVAPDRLRFDFVHISAVTPEQLLDIERIVNEQVLKNTLVQTDVKPTQEAMAAGAMALFGEKYGDRVRVVSVPGFSMELCGGTHVRATGDIGLFVIVGESGIAAGVRRIEAVTGLDALKLVQHQREELRQAAGALNVKSGDLAARIGLLLDEQRKLTRDLQQARMKAAMTGSAGAGPQEETIEIAGVKLVAREVGGLDKNGLRALVDQHRDRIKSGVVVLASPAEGKVSIVVGVTPDLTKRVPAGQVVKQLAPIVGGGGGGRPDFAEAGGKDPSRIPELLAASRGVLEKLLSESRT